jgi:hypothetical protein
VTLHPVGLVFLLLALAFFLVAPRTDDTRNDASRSRFSPYRKRPAGTRTTQASGLRAVSGLFVVVGVLLLVGVLG